MSPRAPEPPPTVENLLERATSQLDAANLATSGSIRSRKITLGCSLLLEACRSMNSEIEHIHDEIEHLRDGGR